MLFNSYAFLFVFLPTALGVYFLLNRLRWTTGSKVWLISASLFFYGWWNLSYLPLLIASVLVNYFIGFRLLAARQTQSSSPRRWLMAGLFFNVGLLGYFKYMDFFIQNVNFALRTDLQYMHLLLPLGISFFTLQQIAYLIDAYEGLSTERRFLDYALFVSFFPQLVAGPIVHHREMMPQFGKLRNKVLNYRNLSLGVLIFAVGLFKKVVVADAFSTWSQAGFDGASPLTFIEGWLSSLSYTFQIYFDFSGYTDMAIGIGLMFNIRLPENFNSPYRATSIINFWQRWHITLTHFITTYVYTPILRAMAPITFGKSLLAVFLAMFISGVWHGAQWTFVVWGMLHGLALAVNHLWRRRKGKMPAFLAWFITFNFVNASLVIFRAREWQDAFRVFRGMLGLNGFELPLSLQLWLPGLDAFGIRFAGEVFGNRDLMNFTLMLLTFGLATLLMKAPYSVRLKQEYSPRWPWALAGAGMLFLSIINLSRPSEFIYFQF